MTSDAAAPTGPFPGLAPFTEASARFFYGRATECEIVVDNLVAHPLSILLGPSGAGKSSLLRAGVLPRLSALDEDEQLAAVLCSTWGAGAVPALREALAARPQGRRLVVLDQFEELFAAAGELDDDVARLLAGAAPGAHILIAIRDDSLALLDRFESAVPGLFDNLIHLDRLAADAAREAIEGPVQAWCEETGEQVRVEPELIDAVLEQVRVAEPGASGIHAPYLQLVMARLWEEEVGAGRRVLGCAALARLDGADRIVADHVEQAMARCTGSERAVAAAMLDVLVTPTGAKVPQRTSDLARYACVPEPEAERVLRHLSGGAARLLEPVADARYQLYHDALAQPVRAWHERWALGQARRRERRRLLGIMGFVAGLLALALLMHGFDPLELSTVDARFALRGALTPPRDVLLVTIDDASLARLNADWPLPRRLEGDAIDWIGEGRPRVIAYDVDFSGRRADDVSLAEAIAGAHRRVVLAADATGPTGQVDVLGGDEVLRAIGARPGYAGLAYDLNDMIRRPLYDSDGLKSFAVTAAETATGQPVAPHALEGAWLDYYGPEGTLRSVPFWEVVRHKVPRRLFRDRIVVVGVTSAAYDRHPAWGIGHADMSGAEIQATAIETILRGLPLRSPPWEAPVALIVCFALLPPLLSRRLPLAITLALTLATAAAYLLAAALLFDDGGVVLQVVAPLAALLVAGLAVSLVGFVAHGAGRGVE